MKNLRYLFLPLLFIFGLSSCRTISYVAEYEITCVDTTISNRELTERIFMHLADEHGLSLNDKYKESDTLGYFGRPYHSFRFIYTDSVANNGTVRLDYWDYYGLKERPYTSLLSNLTDSIEANFIIKTKTITETKK